MVRIFQELRGADHSLEGQDERANSPTGVSRWGHQPNGLRMRVQVPVPLPLRPKPSGQIKNAGRSLSSISKIGASRTHRPPERRQRRPPSARVRPEESCPEKARSCSGHALVASWSCTGLPLVRVPTLILHRTADRNVHVGQARYMAERIAGAKLVELPGEDHLFGGGLHE